MPKSPVAVPATTPEAQPKFVEGAIPELGDELYDLASGVRGVALLKTITHAGCIRFALQPPSKEGVTMPDIWAIDHHHLRVVTKGVLQVFPPIYTEDIRGYKAEDTVSGFRGVVTSMTYSANGCVYSELTPRVKRNKKTGEVTLGTPQSFPSQTLELLDRPVAPPASVGENRPGGPSDRIASSPATRL